MTLWISNIIALLSFFAASSWSEAAQSKDVGTNPKSAQISNSTEGLLAQFLEGPMRDVDEIVFAARKLNPTDGHWYANFGYYGPDRERKAYRDGTKLYRLNLRTGKLTTLLADDNGGIRDPQVHYDGKKILFSYRPGGTEQYHLYELDLKEADGRAAANSGSGQRYRSLSPHPGPLPQGEGEPDSVSRQIQIADFGQARPTILPLPRGEGRGEGEQDVSRADAPGPIAIRHSALAIRQLTDGPFDDIEPTYLPDGGIVFVSSRCKRYVNCWLTQVAVLHRCDADGTHIVPISSNNEHDNTPWPLPDGRILYTRWEYVDRSQVHFHHLWTANPDGTMQQVWFGNMHPGITMIDAKPIAGSHKIVASFSPGHGQREHDGVITVIDPSGGPDAQNFAQNVSRGSQFRDPWAFSEHCFLAAARDTLVILNERGQQETIFKLPEADRAAGMECHEPRPILQHARETIIQPRVKPNLNVGTMLLADVNHGRRMEGVKRGEIKKLLVLETLPMPVHYTGGMEPISYGGTFTLERIVGTVPVEEDGSAYFEAPALRSFFFVALDEHDLSVKRMQSFTTVQPGEQLGCVGCHEHRSQTPQLFASNLLAVRKPARKIEPISSVPDVFDFPRDVQPILDSLCNDCHGYEKTARGGPRAGKLLLAGDHGPLYSHSYYMLTIAQLFADGRNQPRSNYEPRALGSSNSKLLGYLDGSHHGAKATAQQKKMLRLWIESGAAYPGSYAALGCGMIGNYVENNQVNTGADWPQTRAAREVIQRRCSSCHDQPARVLPLDLADERGVSFWMPSMDDPRLNTSRHIVWNLSRPDKSIMLLAPLAESAGGWGLCRKVGARVLNPTSSDGSSASGPTFAAGAARPSEPADVFTRTSDADYQKLLALAVAGSEYLDHDKRFDMAGFKPRVDWVREMKRYGVLAERAISQEIGDVYATERQYWESLWYQPEGTDKASR